MTALCRVATDTGTVWAVQREDEFRSLPVGTTLGGLLAVGAPSLSGILDGPVGAALSGQPLAPVDPDTEVWAAGVTYCAEWEVRWQYEAMDSKIASAVLTHW
jgi:2-dehydro-3-deoxy-D-arabinonate dehydratase